MFLRFNFRFFKRKANLHAFIYIQNILLIQFQRLLNSNSENHYHQKKKKKQLLDHTTKTVTSYSLTSYYDTRRKNSIEEWEFLKLCNKYHDKDPTKTPFMSQFP